MNILVFSKYSYDGPSSRYRFYNYKSCFEKNGIKVVINPLFDKEYFSAKSKLKKLLVVVKAYLKRLFFLLKVLSFKQKYALVLIEYELFPYFPAVFERLFKVRGIKYIVDYDDAIFHKYDMSNSFIIKRFLSKKIATVIKNATKVIVCNSYLENYAKQYNQNLIKLPTVVLLDKYIEKMQELKKEDSKNFIVGWIGSKTTSIYILEILDIFKLFKNKYKNIKFYLVGFDKKLLSEEDIEKYGIVIIPWSEESEVENILKFDVGIMPLHNDPWSQGKCGFKLIQYMSCKKSVIASPVGINKEIVGNENGFLVESEKEWLDALEKIYLYSNLRKEMAKRNFEKIKEEFNFKVNCKKYCTIIRNLEEEGK